MLGCTICCNHPKRNNLQDYIQTVWRPVFRFTGEQQCAVNSVLMLLAETASYRPINSELDNWLANSLDLSYVDYSVWGSLQQIVYRHKISDIDQRKRMLIDCWAHLSQDALNWAINHLPKDWWWLSRQMVRLIVCADVFFTVCWVKIEQRLCLFVKCSINSCVHDLLKLGKEYLNSLKYKFCDSLLDKIRKIWHTTRLSITNHRKVISSEKWSIFVGPLCMS